MNLTCLIKKAQLHGINRLADKKDRVAWLIAFVLVFLTAMASMLTALWRFESNPTFLTRKENGLYTLAFPAVLICPELDFPPFKMERFIEEVKIPPGFNRSYYFSVLRQLVTYYTPDAYYTEKDLKNLDILLEHNALGVETAVLRLTSTCEEILLRCRYDGVMKDCSSLFKMMTMQFGVCCVFNGRSLRMDIISQGFPVKVPQSGAMTQSVGFHSGLIVAVDQKTSKSYRNIDLSYKWAIITTPQRFVDSLNMNGTALSPGHEVWYAYRAVGFEITEDSKSLSFGLRGCELASTRLPHFPVYKRQYCRLECEMLNVLNRCNCSLPTHPTPEFTYCKARSLSCAKNVVRQSTYETCVCAPTCDSYLATFTVTTYDLSATHLPIDEFYNNLNFDEVSIVRVFVQTRLDVKITRRSYFAAHDLFAQMGGIFGVFFGCSVLSLLELLQLVWYWSRKRRAARKTNAVVKITSKKINKNK